jgi:hypothetical protein
VQIVDAGHGLAGAAVRHDAGEALRAAMEGDELPARPVVEADTSYISGHRPLLIVMAGLVPAIHVLLS